jgi:cytochrome c oxidase subunit 4
MSSSHPITSVFTYSLVFLVLIVGTAVTVWIAYFDFGLMNTAIALSVAVAKATLVVWYFMGVRYNTPLTKVVVVSGLVWLVIMFGLGMSDYLTRAWLGVPGR